MSTEKQRKKTVHNQLKPSTGNKIVRTGSFTSEDRWRLTMTKYIPVFCVNNLFASVIGSYLETCLGLQPLSIKLNMKFVSLFINLNFSTDIKLQILWQLIRWCQQKTTETVNIS